MARDTDRKIISEAVRLSETTRIDCWLSNNQAWIMNDNVRTGVIQVTYSPLGRLTDVYHAGATGVASKRVTTGKRQYVLDFIAGKGED